MRTRMRMLTQDHPQQPSGHAAITTCYNAGVFSVLAKHRGVFKKATEIARTLGIDSRVLGILPYQPRSYRVC